MDEEQPFVIRYYLEITHEFVLVRYIDEKGVKRILCDCCGEIENGRLIVDRLNRGIESDRDKSING